MSFFSRYLKRWTALFVVLSFVLQLSGPAVIYAAESEEAQKTRERIDKRLLTKIGNRIEIILRSVCEKVSKSEDHDVQLKTFLLDKKHRIFADIKGTVTIRYPRLMKKSVEKLKSAVGKCLSTNGSLAFDFSVMELEELNEQTFRLKFQADIVITLIEVIRFMFLEALNLFGNITIGTSVSKATNFFDSIDTDNLAIAVGEGLKTLWALGAGKIAMDSYRMYDATGSVKIKKLLAETFTVKSVIYHFGGFILKAGINSGASLAKLSLGGALGVALAGQVGAFIGAALAAAAITILGDIIIHQLTVKMPMGFRMRRIRKIKHKLEQVEPGSEEENELLTRLEATEDATVAFLKEEILLDRYKVFQTFTKRMKKAYEEDELHYYDGLIEKAKGQLQTSAVYDENWNAARYYYQLLKAINQLPATEQASENPTERSEESAVQAQ